MQIVTGPVPATGPLIPKDAVAVVGVVGIMSADPVPLVLIPGYEYHLTEWYDEHGQRQWVVERRAAARSTRNYHQRDDNGREPVESQGM